MGKSELLMLVRTINHIYSDLDLTDKDDAFTYIIGFIESHIIGDEKTVNIEGLLSMLKVFINKEITITKE